MYYYLLANKNQFQGLARGPIDHESSSVINAIADAAITMGTSVTLNSSIVATEILPRVLQTPGSLGSVTYGIAVGGDNDGIYPIGNDIASPTNNNRATLGAGQGVVVVTRGRCVARVSGSPSIAIDDPLTPAALTGQLVKATSDNFVIARALQPVASGDLDMIAVEVNKEGKGSL